MQQGRPISFLSQALKGRAILLSTYENELYALVNAIQKGRPYLLVKSFVVKTKHHSLQYLLDHKIGTPMQHKWLRKLLGYDFVVEYKNGPKNRVADAVSCKEEEVEEMSLALLSVPSIEWLEEIKQGYNTDF